MTDVSVHFLDVGHGDCTVAIDHEQNESIVIDCPARHHDTVVGLLASHGDPAPRQMLATHTHADHLFGLEQLATTYADSCDAFHLNVDTYFNAVPPEPHPGQPGRTRKPSGLQAVFTRLLEGKAPLHRLHEGDSGTVGAITWHSLLPRYSDLVEAAVTKTPNYGSAAILLEAGPCRILVGGDACSGPLHYLIRHHMGPVDILRYPHHGNVQRSGPPLADKDLLDALSPSLTVMSVGSRTLQDTSSPHPPSKTLLAVRQSGSTLLCTQLNRHCADDQVSRPTPCAGTVSIRIDGQGWMSDPDPITHVASIRYLPAPHCL